MCKECITFSICRGSMITFMKTFRQKEKLEEKERINRLNKMYDGYKFGVSEMTDLGLIYRAYEYCILPKCKLIPTKPLGTHQDEWRRELKLIIENLDIKKEHYAKL